MLVLTGVDVNWQSLDASRWVHEDTGILMTETECAGVKQKAKKNIWQSGPSQDSEPKTQLNVQCGASENNSKILVASGFYYNQEL